MRSSFQLIVAVCYSCAIVTKAWTPGLHSLPYKVTSRGSATSLSEKIASNAEVWLSSDPKKYKDGDNDNSSRRNFLLVASSAIATTPAAVVTIPRNIPDKNSLINTPAKTMGVTEAIQWIDQYCDRRFLHAMVSSDYQFLYRGVDELEEKIDFRKENPDLLLPDSGYYSSSDTKAYFRRMESFLLEEPVRPSNGHLATTSIRDASQFGYPASIWPRQGAHFAWFQSGGTFYPRIGSMSRNDIIIDGKDCGKDSLEDTLQLESCEVMMFSPDNSFLSVPASMDVQIREVLKSSFLI